MTGPGRGTVLRAADGFTLIEALVALAIGGFVIATLATVTGQWMRHWQVGVPVLQRSQALVAGLDRIVADVAAARYLPAGGAGPGYVFTGEPTAITLVRQTLPVETPPGLEIVRLAALSETGDVTLARSRSPLPFGASLKAPTDPAPVALLRQPHAVRFGYADADQAWQTSWRTPARLPRLVRIEVVDRRSGHPVLPAIVVRLHADAPPACAALTSGTSCDAALGLPPRQARTATRSTAPAAGDE